MKGEQVHDANIVATMRWNGITCRAWRRSTCRTLVVARAFASARAAPGLRKSTERAENREIPLPYEPLTKVGPPGIEPGLRSRGSGF